MPKKKVEHKRTEQRFFLNSYNCWEAATLRTLLGYEVEFCDYGLRQWWDFPKKIQEFWLVISTDPSAGYELVFMADYYDGPSWRIFSPSKEHHRILPPSLRNWLEEFRRQNPDLTTLYGSLEYMG